MIFARLHFDQALTQSLTVFMIYPLRGIYELLVDIRGGKTEMDTMGSQPTV